MASCHYKEKLLHLLRIFERETDEQHAVSIAGLIEKLAQHGIRAERKSLYDDIHTLASFGYDIKTAKKGRYYLDRRVFLPSEIRLVSDALQAARFIPEDKTRMLLTKLYSLLPEQQARRISGQVFLEHRPKADNDELYENIERLQEAVEKGRKIEFKYFDYNAKKEKVYRKDGADYRASPYALVWFEDAYYLVCNMDKYGNLAHYRVDRMNGVRLLREKARPVKEVSEFSNYIDVADYLKGTFSMFGGRPQTVRLRFRENLATAVFGRFGMDADVLETGGGVFTVSVKVRLSEGFFSWLLHFEDGVEVLYPREVRELYASRIKKTLAIYE